MRDKGPWSTVQIVVASILGSVLLVCMALVVVAIVTILQADPDAASWSENEKAQVRQFAEQIAVVGHVPDVRFHDTEGGLGSTGAFATIAFRPGPGADRFTQSDFDTLIATLGARGWHIVADACYDGDGPGVFSCPLTKGGAIHMHPTGIGVDIGHSAPFALGSTTP